MAGRVDETLDFLEQAYAQHHDEFGGNLKSAPEWDILREQPRFKGSSGRCVFQNERALSRNSASGRASLESHRRQSPRARNSSPLGIAIISFMPKSSPFPAPMHALDSFERS